MRRGNMWMVIALISFVVAVLQPRPVEALTVIYLGDAGWSAPPEGEDPYGTWNEDTKTGTLTRDVTEPIEILNDYITLDGNGKSATGSGLRAGVFIDSKTAVTIRNIILTGFQDGIWLTHSTSCILTGNTVDSNNCYGIYLGSSSGNTLTGNTASNNQFGIYLYASSGNTIIGNTVDSNSAYGIYLEFSDSNTLTGNTANSQITGDGIRLWTSNENMLTGNTVWNNDWGICLYAGSSNNRVYNNNFIDNTTQAFVDSSCSDNAFNLQWPIGGNFWSNWTGPDDDSDGFVDDPYEFDEGGQDELPWTKQDAWVPEVALGNLVGTVVDLNIQEGITNSLDGKLDAALNALDDINENNDVAAINSLQAFINAVEAQRGNKIADADADALIAAAQAIIATLLGA